MSIEAYPAANRPHLASTVFFAVVLGLSAFVLDPRAMDPTGQPRLLLILLASASLLGWSLLRRSGEFWEAPVLGSPVVLFFAAYVFLGALSLFPAVNPLAGISDLVRNWTTLVLVVLFAFLLRGKTDCWNSLFRVFAVIGFLCAGIAWLEKVTNWGWGIRPRMEMERVSGLMYNGNLHASFLLLLLPFVACAALMLRGAWRWISVASVLALLVMVFLLQSRSAYAGLLAGAVVGVAVALVFWRQLGLTRMLHASALVAGMVVAGAFAWAVLLAGDNPLAGRGSFLSLDPRSAGGSRLAVWDAALRMAFNHPLSGVGAGNFALVIHQYYDVSDPSLGSLDTNWQEPHNDFLWVFAEKGVAAGLCFISVFVFAGVGLVRAVARSSDRQTALPPFFALVGLVAYATVSFFDFPLASPAHQAFLALYLSVSVASAPGWEVGVNLSRVSPETKRVVVAICLLVCLVFAGHTLSVLRQEWYVRLARQEIENLNWDEVVAHARQARWSLNQIDPLGVPVSFLEGLGHLMGGREDDAVACFSLAAQQSPHRDFIQHNLAVLHSAQDRPDLAIGPLQGIVERGPGNLAARVQLAEAFLASGNPASALRELQQLPPGFRSDHVRALRERAAQASASSAHSPAAKRSQ